MGRVICVWYTRNATATQAHRGRARDEVEGKIQKKQDRGGRGGAEGGGVEREGKGREGRKR